MHTFQVKTTKSSVKPKVKGGHNLDPDLTTLRAELKATLDTTVEGREKYKNWLEHKRFLLKVNPLWHSKYPTIDKKSPITYIHFQHKALQMANLFTPKSDFVKWKLRTHIIFAFNSFSDKHLV
jgi:hypothetical protein